MVKDQLIGVDEVKITIVMDNTIDVLMAGETNVQRFETGSLEANGWFISASSRTWFLCHDPNQIGR